MQLPVTSAGAILQIANQTGKFHGVIPPTTPSGEKREWGSFNHPAFVVPGA
jgi:hypothetical protein